MPLYEAGAVVDYASSGGTQTCTVLSAHFDDMMEPHYTVRLEDGREKQTDNAHISPRRSEEPRRGGGCQRGKSAPPRIAPPLVAREEERVDPSAGNAPSWYRRFLGR